MAESYSKKMKEERLMAFNVFRHLEQEGIDDKRSLDWVNRCHMSLWVELYILVAQEFALFTKYHEAFILNKAIRPSRVASQIKDFKI